MARKIVKKSSAKLYGDKFVKVSDTGDTQFYIRHFGHVGTEKNPNIELAVVAQIQDLEGAVSEDELPEEGNFQLNITLVPYEKYISPKLIVSATEDSSSDNVLVDVVEYMGGLNYEPQEKFIFKTAKAAEKYLYSKELNDLISGHGILSGFILDKHYNRIGQTNWDRLAYMTGESSKFEKGGSVGGKRKIVKKLPMKGFIDGGAADLSTKEKAEMYVWIDKALLREDLGSKHDLYKWFAEKFKKTAEQTEDIIDNGWAVSRGAGKHSKFAKGGGVDVKFKAGDVVKKKGSNLSLDVLAVSRNKEDGKYYITIYNDVTNHTDTVNNLSDYELVKYAKGGGVGEPKEIKKRLEYLRKELRAERISYEELAELQSLSKYIDAGDVELLQAAGVPEFDYEWLVTLKGKDGDEIDEEVEAKTEDEAMNKAEKKHEGSKALSVVQLTDDNGKIEYANGGAISDKLTEERDGDTIVLKRGRRVYAEISYNKNPDYKWTLFINPKAKSGMALSGFKSSEDAIKRANELNGEFNKAVSGLYAKGGSVSGKRKIVKKSAKGSAVSKVNDIDSLGSGTKIPDEVYFKGERYFGKAGFINGFNGYTSAKDDGMLCAFTQEKGYQKEKLSLWSDNAKPNYLTDKDGSKLMSKNYRGQSVTFEENGVRHFANGGEVEGYLRFKEGITVKVDEVYLKDEASPEGASATATVMSEPSDDEELVQIQYENGSIDYLGQEWLEPVDAKFAKGGGVASTQEYQLLFANQSVDSKVKYRVVRETPMYLFLQEITKEPNFIFRVHKKTLSVKGIKEGEDGYQWDVPSAISLTKIPSSEYAKGGSVGSKRKIVKKWYSSTKPDEKTYVMYDFARSEEQAKNMLRDLHEGSPIAHKSTSQGGEYNIYVKKGSVLWREKGGSVTGKRKIVKKAAKGSEVSKVKDIDSSGSGTKIPDEVYFKGKRYFGKAGFINGFNGYTSAKDDGMLCAFTQEKGYQEEKLSLWGDNAKPNYLTDKDGSKLMSKNYRGQSVTFEENGVRHFANGGEVEGYLRFKEGITVKVDEAYLKDEASPEGASATATVMSEPSDDEELVQIQYENGSIDYLGQEWLELVSDKAVGVKDYDSLVLKYMYPKHKRKPAVTVYHKVDTSKEVKVGGSGEKGYKLIFKDGGKSDIVITERQLRELIAGEQIESSGASVSISGRYGEQGKEVVLGSTGTKVFLPIDVSALDKNETKKLYLDYVNNFVTIQGFADYYELSDADAKFIIAAGNRYKQSDGHYDKGGSVGGKRKVVKKWYSSTKPDEKTYVMYDFARSEEQAKNMLRDLHEGSPIAHKSTSQGGEYNIYVKKGSVLWREKGGSVTGKRKIVKKAVGIDAKDAGKEDHSSHYEKIAGHEFYIDKVKKEYWLLMNGAPVFKNADKALAVKQKGIIKGILLSVEGKRKIIKKK